MRGTYLILATDYSRYAVVKSTGSAFGRSYELLWVLARRPDVSEPLARVWLEQALNYTPYVGTVKVRDSRIAKSESTCALL